MVGLDKFQQHFAAFADQYVLIGGVATMLALEEQGLEARAHLGSGHRAVRRGASARLCESILGFCSGGRLSDPDQRRL